MRASGFLGPKTAVFKHRKSCTFASFPSLFLKTSPKDFWQDSLFGGRELRSSFLRGPFGVLLYPDKETLAPFYWGSLHGSCCLGIRGTGLLNQVPALLKLQP